MPPDDRLTLADLDALDALLAKATAGPWSARGRDVDAPTGGSLLIVHGVPSCAAHPIRDAEAIAALRNAAPRLIAMARGRAGERRIITTPTPDYVLNRPGGPNQSNEIAVVGGDLKPATADRGAGLAAWLSRVSVREDGTGGTWAGPYQAKSRYGSRPDGAFEIIESALRAHAASGEREAAQADDLQRLNAKYREAVAGLAKFAKREVALERLVTVARRFRKAFPAPYATWTRDMHEMNDALNDLEPKP